MLGSLMPFAKLKVKRVPLKYAGAPRTLEVVRERDAWRAGHAEDRVVLNAAAQRVEQAIPQAALNLHHVAEIVAVRRRDTGVTGCR